MRKLVTISLAIAIICAIAVPVMAAPTANAEPTELTWTNGFGFHCNECGGNGQTTVTYVGKDANVIKAIGNIKKQPAGSLDVLKGDQKDIFGTKVFPIKLDRIGTTTTWNLMTDDIVCATCGRTEWVTFSNNSGVINGKNIQAHHPALPEPLPPVVYGSLTILKTVGGVPFLEWAAAKGFSADRIVEIIAGLKFVAYRLTGENGVRVTPELSYEGKMSITNGVIDFGQVQVGWYEVVETVSGAANTYFADSNETSNLYFVDKSGLAGGSATAMANFISGQNNVGTVVHCDADCSFGESEITTGRKDHVLPDVWNTQLASDLNFIELQKLGAQWIWDAECTHIYGSSGSIYEESFAFNAAKAGSSTLYLACDNAAVVYLNGKLAGYTTVAFKESGSGIEPAADLVKWDKKDLVASVFNGGWSDGWCNAYGIEINFEKGFNTLTIIALNSIGTTGSGTANDTYNEKTNPCGVIFGFEVPAITFDNEEIPEVYSGIEVVPMASVGYSEIADGETWGLEVWPQNGYKNRFIALSGYENDGFVSGLRDVQGQFIWDKPQAEVNENDFGEDVGYFKFTYDFEHTDPYSIEFSDFIIAADNEFALVVNGKIIKVSDNFRIVTGVGEGYEGKLDDIFNLDNLSQYEKGFWDLNDPNNNLNGVYGWDKPNTIIGADMLEAFMASGDASVVIEIYTYNIPENTDLEGYPYQGLGNPAMLIFAGSFKYEYKYTA